MNMAAGGLIALSVEPREWVASQGSLRDSAGESKHGQT